MKFSDLVLLGEGIYEWEKGHSESRFRETGTFVIRFGSFETDLAPRKIEGDAEIPVEPESVGSTNGNASLPYPLQDQSLQNLHVSGDGSYKDEGGEEQKLTSAHMEVIVKMTTGQRLIIVEAKDDGSPGQSQENEPKTGNIT